MSSRGDRSIFGRTVRGHELVRDTCKEGDNNTKRSPAGQAYPWGAIDSAQQQNLGPFQDHPQYSQGNNQEKLCMITLHGRGGYWSSYRGLRDPSEP